MADLDKKINIILNGEDKGLSRTFRAVNKKLDKFSGNVQAATGPLADIGRKIVMVEGALVGMVSAGIALSIKSFAEFEDVMLKVKGVIGANSEEYEQLTDLTKELGATTRYTATEAAQGLEFLALAGFSVEDSISALPRVLNLAQASALDLGDAADIVTNIMAGYGVGVQDLAQTNDVLTATFTNSNTSLEQLGQAFKFVGPVAKGLGLDIEETAALLGTLGNAGYQAEKGGTALRNILLALVAPMGNTGKLMKQLGVDTEEMGVDLASSANALRSLGVEVKDAEGNLKPFPDIMDELSVGLQKIPDQADRAATLVEIFGKRGGPQMQALLSQGSGAVEGLEEKIRSLGGVTDKIAEDMESGIGGSLRAFRSAFQATAIEIGEAASNDVAPAIGGLTEVFRIIAEEVDRGTFDPIFEALGDFADDLEATFNDIAENAPEALEGIDWSGLMDSFRDLGNEVKDVFDLLLGGEIDLSTVDGLEDAIQRLVDLFQGLTEFTTGFIKGIEPMAAAIGLIGEKAGDAADQGAELAGKIAGMSQTVNTAFQAFDALKGVISAFLTISFVEKIAGWTMSLKTLATSSTSVIGSAAGKTGLLGLSAAAGYAMGTIINKYVPGVSEAAEKTWSWVDAVIHFTDKQEAAEKAADSFDKAVESWIENIGQYSTDLGWLRKELQGLGYDVEGMTNEMILEVSADEGILEIKDLMRIKREAADEIEKPMEMKVDTTSTETVGETWAKTIKDLDHLWVGTKEDIEDKPIEPDVDTEKASKEIDKLAEKKLEVKAEIETAEINKDIAKIEATADTIQTAMEWEAKIDIAEAKASAEKMKAIMESVGTAIQSTGQSIGDAMSALSDENLSTLDKWAIEDYFEAEAQRRAEAFEQQKKLVEQQVKLNDLKIDRMESGEAMMQISVDDSVEPALKLVMMNILELMQTEFNESASEFLMGWESVSS